MTNIKVNYMNLKLSVLLSIYYKEKAQYLEQSLNSILHQTLLPDEIIIIKDGPLTPELDKIIEEYSQKHSIFKVIPLSVNQGLGKALNEGLKYCSFELIARMDTDDIAKANRFEKQVRIFQHLPDIDVVGSWIDEFESDISNIISTRKLPKNHSKIYKFAKKCNPINHPTVMFKKSAVISAGGYQHFPLFEDYYLWIRMLLNGSNFYNIQESLLFFRTSLNVFKRRGGFKYAINEIKLRREMKRMGFISQMEFIKDLPLRFISRIIPSQIRFILYRKLLRK